MLPEINLQLGDKVYYPSKTNDILEVTNFLDSNPFPIILGFYTGNFSIEGVYCSSDLNPSIFPATEEWYNILKNVYPNLKPPTISIKVQLIKTITEYYEIKVEENDPMKATEIAKNKLKNSTEGFNLIDLHETVNATYWEEV